MYIIEVFGVGVRVNVVRVTVGVSFRSAIDSYHRALLHKNLVQYTKMGKNLKFREKFHCSHANTFFTF